jgi:endogenous inhibitor of DNA gyrase (YacG/DUF329 family)
MIKVRCPICERTMMGASVREWPDFPFCSARCRMVDLGRWLGGSYAVQGDTANEQEESPAANDEQDIP